MNDAVEQPLDINLCLCAQCEMVKLFLSADICKNRFDDTHACEIYFVSVGRIDFVDHLRNNVRFV